MSVLRQGVWLSIPISEVQVGDLGTVTPVPQNGIQELVPVVRIERVE